MAKPSLYDVTSREVSPVSDLLKAVVEVNWHLAAAMAAGWDVDLSVMSEGGELSVEVSRDNCWPSAESEAEASLLRTPQAGKEIPGGA